MERGFVSPTTTGEKRALSPSASERRCSRSLIDIGDRASTYNFDQLPESIAVIGGGDRPDDIKAIMDSTDGEQKIELGKWSDIMNADSTDILSVSADKVSFTVTNKKGVVDVFNFTGDAALQILGTMSSRVDLKDKWSSDGGTSADGVESGFSGALPFSTSARIT